MQEFLALGVSHIWSSFFSCFPVAASVPRSAVQENAGGKTQIVSVVNIIIILFMVLFLGHYLEQLPVVSSDSLFVGDGRNLISVFMPYAEVIEALLVKRWMK